MPFAPRFNCPPAPFAPVGFSGLIQRVWVPGGGAPAIDVKWNQNTVAHMNVPLSLFVNGGQAADVRIRLHIDLTLDVVYAGQAIYTRVAVPGLTPLSGARFALGARTGGLRQLHTLDDLSLQLTLGASDPAWENITSVFPAAAVN